MFSDRYGLTQSVLEGRKTMTRRICKYNRPDETYDIAFPVFEPNDYDNDVNIISPLDGSFDGETTKETLQDGIYPNTRSTKSLPLRRVTRMPHKDVILVDSRYDAFRTANWGDGKDGAEWADRQSAKKQSVTIDAWVARDECGDLSLWDEHPYRNLIDTCNYWECLGGDSITLPKNAFQALTWDNSPKKVKVTIELEEEE